MHLKKILKYSSFALIIVSIVLGTSFYIRKKQFLHREKVLLSENKQRNQRYTQVPYIEIPSLKISKIIEKDSSKETLDRYQVGIWNSQKDISKINHLILAGHNVKTVFGPLHRIQKGALIYIYDKDKKYVYEVTQMKEIKITETKYLESTTYRCLSLITCTENNQTRWLVRAKIKEP